MSFTFHFYQHIKCNRDMILEILSKTFPLDVRITKLSARKIVANAYLKHYGTRLHSSRMRTARALTVSRGGVVYLPGPGGVPAWPGGVPAWSGGCTCLVRGGCTCLVPGGCTCLVRGEYLPGPGGGYLPGPGGGGYLVRHSPPCGQNS